MSHLVEIKVHNSSRRNEEGKGKFAHFNDQSDEHVLMLFMASTFAHL